MMPHLLLIDDDPVLVPLQVRQAFPDTSYRLGTATTGAQGVDYVSNDPPDLVLLDLHLPDQSGLDVYDEIRKIDPRIPVIFITMTKTANTAIEAVKRGAYDYLFKPLDQKRLLHVVLAALQVVQRMREPVVRTGDAPVLETDDTVYGSCEAMLSVYKQIGRVAAQDVTVLLTGESGTGKELAARAIYQHSARSDAPFLALNCAAIPDNLLESELFGHEKGAFSGADRRRIGKFEQCHGGTILLDEIGDMPLLLQAKILRLLQDQTFERVGGNETVRTNVRIIASTHRDLKARSAEDKFRADLYYRLSVFTIKLPSLRDRGEDLALLAQHYTRLYSCELGRHIREIAPDALDLLCNYRWPGNIRELQSVIKQALLQASGTVLLPSFLPDGLTAAPPASTPEVDGPLLKRFISRHMKIDETNQYVTLHAAVDRLFLPLVLDCTNGNQRQAAQMLGLARQTLRGKLRDIEFSTAISTEADAAG